ncbi:MAG: NAD-dependent epimerase/dehydratase family protein [Chloroflexi bacterium]|nr:NAD-dependent epimerase/dehydratase family protein [Chloroflexota bacterium]
MRILITGAAGFIGSHLAERLLAKGHSVVGLDCLTDYYARALKELNVAAIRRAGADFLPLDLATDDLSDAVAGVDLLYHLAAQPGISATTPFETYLRNNIIATHRLLEALRRLPSFPPLINISTSSVYGADATGPETVEPRPTSNYGVTKLAAEQLVLAEHRDRGAPTCSLRLFSVYGPRERPEKLYPKLIGAILDDRPFTLYEGSEAHVRSYTYVSDIVDGLVAVLDHLDACWGEIFNIGTDQAITTGEAIALVEEIMGKRAIIDRRPPRPGDQQRTHACIDKARRLLGYNPTTTPREGLAREVAWYRDEIWGRIRF